MRRSSVNQSDKPRAVEAKPEEDNVADWVEEMYRRKVRILGNRLKGVEHAITVRRRKGKVLVTDGPFAERSELRVQEKSDGSVSGNSGGSQGALNPRSSRGRRPVRATSGSSTRGLGLR